MISNGRAPTLAAILVLSVCINTGAGITTDSLAYVSIRARVMQRDSANQVVPTADALAEAGLFTEAAELLRELAPPDDSVDSSAMLLERPPTVQWRISSGADYYHLEDVDTVVMTPEELRDYKRLTETPLSMWLRAKSAVRPGFPGIEEIDPEVYVSERKGRIETTARFLLPGDMVRLEPSIKGEKRFRADASGQSPFEPGKSQPSDMGGTSFLLSVDNSSRTRAKYRFTVPFAVDWEHYRDERPGYESFVEFRLLPTVELQAGRLPLQWRFSGQVQYEDYYIEESDPLDVVRMSGRVESTMRGTKSSVSVSAAWMGDRYTNASDPATIDRFEGALRGGCTIAGPLDARLRLRGIYEKETCGPEVDSIAGDCGGAELTACPGLELVLFSKRLHAGPDLLWEHRFAEKIGDRFIWEARRALEPGVRAGWSGGVIDASIRAAFRSENIDAAFESDAVTDSRSLRGGAEVSVSPFDVLSIDLFADYQYRTYAPFNVKSRVSENITVSASVTVRWQ